MAYSAAHRAQHIERGLPVPAAHLDAAAEGPDLPAPHVILVAEVGAQRAAKRRLDEDPEGPSKKQHR